MLLSPAAAFSQAPPAKPASPPMSLQSTHGTAGGPESGTVVETMNAGGYTYVLLDTGREKIWAAGPQTAVRVGDKVRLQGGMPMRNFLSKSLNRTFETIYFAAALVPAGPGSAPAPAATPAAPPTGMPNAHASAPAAPVTGISKLADGYTIAELFAKKNELAGKKVRLRAQVVKVSRGILGKNWMHLQDGTGAQNQNDLTVNTGAEAGKGDVVVASGLLTRDKDIGMGYRYELIIEDAEIKIEKPAKP